MRNDIADSLSRLQLDWFRRVAPLAKTLPSEVAPSTLRALLDELYRQQQISFLTTELRIHPLNALRGDSTISQLLSTRWLYRATRQPSYHGGFPG